MNMLTTILLRAAVYMILLTGGIALLVQMTAALLGGEIIVYSWSALLLFSFATLLWIVPLQIIDWLKLIKVHERMKRIMFPYFVTLVQVIMFSMYVTTLSASISNIAFSAAGLAAIIISMTVLSRMGYAMLVRSVRKYKTPRVRISAE